MKKMEKKTEIIKKTEGSTLPDGNSPAEMIRMAVSGGADLDKMEKLLDLQMKYESNEAKKAYVKAMAAFKLNPPKITKDKMNSQYKSKYTSLGNLINTVNPSLSANALSASWDIEQNGMINVTCRLTHALGHSECASASAPLDTSGSKNAIQQIKSTITYLKGVTFESITGLASSDANFDDDGHHSQEVECISSEQLATLVEWITTQGANQEKFLKYLGVEQLESLPKSQYNKALTALKAKGNKK